MEATIFVNATNQWYSDVHLTEMVELAILRELVNANRFCEGWAPPPFEGSVSDVADIH